MFNQSDQHAKKQSGLFFNPICFLLLIAALTALPLSPRFDQPEMSDFAGWKYADLLWLDSGDSSTPESSLIAVYFRQQPIQAQIRLDLLDLNHYDACDLTIALDLYPGGSTQLSTGEATALAWDLLISIPAGEMPRVSRADGSPVDTFRPRVQIDPALEVIIISWNRDSLGISSNRLNFQVFLYPPGGAVASSRSPVLHPGQKPPPSAPLLLAFWNTLPAATPAQALRRWDGAHTGPLGQRHGLNTLLTRAAEYNIPLTLLDLRHPQSLSVLEYMEHASQVQKNIASRQVLAPNVFWGDPVATSISHSISRDHSHSLGWAESQFIFGPIPVDQITPGLTYFADAPDRQHILNWRGSRFIPLPVSPFNNPQMAAQDGISQKGLSIQLKQSLLSTALSADEKDLVVLGGALNQSLWAEDSVAPLAFRYIANHPWIAPLDGDQMAAFPATVVNTSPVAGCTDLLCSPDLSEISLRTSLGKPLPSGITLNALKETFRNTLASLPENDYARHAKNAYLNLTAAGYDPRLAELKAGYLHQVGYLIYAAQWAQHPIRLASANLDVDWDGMPEVVLTSEQYIVIAELDDGRIVLAGSKTDLWMAPSSLFAVGLGAPEEWRMGFGESSDPTVIQGALAEASIPLQPFKVTFNKDALVLTHPSGKQKTIGLSESGIEITVEGTQPFQETIPFVLSLDNLSPTQWASTLTPTCQEHTCSFATSGGSVVMGFNADSMSIRSCLDSAAFITSPEIPDRNYPPGHFLPFPLAVLDLSANDFLKVTVFEMSK